MAWSQVTVARDEDRAFKRSGFTEPSCSLLAQQQDLAANCPCRFKTRMQHVQNSEKKLEDKRKHCKTDYLLK